MGDSCQASIISFCRQEDEKRGTMLFHQEEKGLEKGEKKDKIISPPRIDRLSTHVG